MTVISKDLPAPARRPISWNSLLPVMGAVFSLDCLAALVVMGYGNGYLINVLHAPSSYPAYAIGVYGVVKLTVAPPGGWLLERLRSGAIAVLAGVASGSGLGIIIATHSAGGYFAGVGFLSLGSSLAWLDIFHSVGGRHDASERGSVMASVGLVSAAATGAGLGMAALFGEAPGWKLAFLTGLVLSVTTTAFLLAMRRQPGEAPVPPAPVAATGPAPRQQRRAAAIVVFLHFALVSGMLAAVAPFALRTLDLSLLQAGVAITPAGALGVLAMFAVGRRSRAATRLRAATLLYLLSGLALVGVAGAPGPAWFALAAVPLAVGLAGATPLVNASLLDAARAGTGSGVALGYLFFAEGLGSIIGPVFVALAITAGDERGGVVATALMALGLAGAAALGSKQAAL